LIQTVQNFQFFQKVVGKKIAHAEALVMLLINLPSSAEFIRVTLWLKRMALIFWDLISLSIVFVETESALAASLLVRSFGFSIVRYFIVVGCIGV